MLPAFASQMAVLPAFGRDDPPPQPAARTRSDATATARSARGGEELGVRTATSRRVARRTKCELGPTRRASARSVVKPPYAGVTTARSGATSKRSCRAEYVPRPAVAVRSSVA